jgi:ATP-dependent helicase HrpB
LSSDLSGLVLTLAEWGERDARNLTWMDVPPAGRLKAATDLLVTLRAIDGEGRLTPLGSDMSRLPLPPRLAALVAGAEGGERALAAEVAALAGERGMGGTSVDLRERLARFRQDRTPRGRVLQDQAKSWGRGAAPSGDLATLLARAWPDEVARKRPGSPGTYLLASGRAATLPETDALARSDWLVVADLGGASKEARISLALPLSEADALASGHVVTEDRADFDPKTGRFTARRVKALGAIVLSETPLPKPSADVAARAVLAAVETQGLASIGADEAVEETLSRLALLENAGLVEPQGLTLEGVTASAADWLLPLLKKQGAQVPAAHHVREALIAWLGWNVQDALRREAPLSLELPSGQSARVDYLDPRAPLVSARAQAFWGCAEHLTIAAGRVPVTVEMLSPGMKPVATTRDLPAFWKGGYRDMAKDMRGRYPKHDWPDDPAGARPHAGKTKKRL